MSTIKSKRTNQPIDVEGAFLKIRDIIDELEFNLGEETPYDSDELDTALSTFDTLMDALYFWYAHDGGEHCMAENMSTSIYENWDKLKMIIEVRYRGYGRICKLAMHGTETIFGDPEQEAKEKTLEEDFKEFMENLRDLKVTDRDRANAYYDRLLDVLNETKNS